MRTLIFLALVACTTNTTTTAPGDDDEASCSQIAGTWATSGTCGDDTCTIVQSGCTLTQVSCVSGSHSTSGMIDGESFTYRGFGPTGMASTCQGTHSGSTISGTCNAGTCTFSGRRS
jgi:hypothetical protein